MYLIIQMSGGVKCVGCKNHANVLLPSSQRSVCTICVFINKMHVQKLGGLGASQ